MLSWYEAIDKQDSTTRKHIKMTDTDQMIDRYIELGIQEDNFHQLSLQHNLANFLLKLDPDLSYCSGIKYKSGIEDCGQSVDGHTKGNGWKMRIQWDEETHILWSPSLKALLNAALEFLKSRVKVNED